MPFNYSKLRGKIREVYGTEKAFALALKIGKTSLSQRLNNVSEFSQMEIDRACVLLGFDRVEIPKYFFTQEVQKHEQNAS